MTSRADILSNIRRSLGVSADDATRRAAVAQRLAAKAPGVRPARGQGDEAARVGMFTAQAEMVSTTVARVASAADVPGAVADFLRAHNLPATLRMGADARLAEMPWAATPFTVTKGASAGADLTALSHAEAGVAETGTLVLLSGPDNPTTLNFLPDNHIVVLRAADVEADLEAVWARLRARYGAGVLPRTVNLVTGPSRSADIEQKLLLGAHGPRRLHVVIVDS